MGVRTNVIEIPCRLAGKSIPLRIFVESHDFQILLGDLLSIDKVEGTEILAQDVEGLVVDILAAIKDKRATVFEYNFLSKKKYSLALQGHAPYVTFSEVLVKWLGKKTQIDVLEFEA